MLRHMVEEINEGYYSDSSESEQEEIVEQEAIVPAVRRRPQPAIVPAVRRRPQPAIVPVTPENSIKTERDDDLLMHDGYQFWKQDVAVKKTYWRCVKVTEEECKARVHTDNLTGQVVDAKGEHTHGRSAIAVPVRNVKNEIKRRAVVTMEKPSQIFNTILRGVPEAVQATLDKSATRQVVQKKRRRVNQGNQVPAAANGINFAFPDAFKTYKSAQNEPELFLLADELFENGKRILLFGRESNKVWSAQMKVVFMDGTFKITPVPFYQTYVILAERDGYVFPVMYALLPDKSQETHERLFQMIKRVWPEFSPSSVSVDYERAVINALQIVFGDSEIWGCFFHLMQNLKKHLAENLFKQRYETEPDFAIQCRMIIAMAFVKPEDIMPVFAELEELLPIELDPVLEWFKKSYIGSENRRGIMRPPMFAHSLWNVYDRTLNGDHRTNNYAEAANHRIQTELDVCHPGLWNFIECLKSVQQGRDQKYLQWEAGKRPKGKRTKYIQADARILQIVQSYEARNTNEFLRGIARNFAMED